MVIKREELDNMIFSDVSAGTRLAPVHPGEVLLHDFMEPLGVTQHRLAITIGVPPRRINEIVHSKRGITAVRLYGWEGSSGRRRISGQLCRLHTILKTSVLAYWTS